MALRSVASAGFGLLVLVLLPLGMACQMSREGPATTVIPSIQDDVATGGEASRDLLFEAVVARTDAGTRAWVRLCDEQRQPIPDARVQISGQDLFYFEPRHMVFFDETCAHYEGAVEYVANTVYRLLIQVDEQEAVRGEATTPVLEDLVVTRPEPLATIPRNENFTLTWSYTGPEPQYVLLALLDRTGRRLYVAFIDGRNTSFTIAADDLLSLPPGEHRLWVFGLNGIQINTRVRDPRLGLGSGFWLGILKELALFFI